MVTEYAGPSISKTVSKDAYIARLEAEIRGLKGENTKGSSSRKFEEYEYAGASRQSNDKLAV